MAVPTGTNNVVVTLVFPAVPIWLHGHDVCAVPTEYRCGGGQSHGGGQRGEVEDYRVTITKSAASPWTVKTKKIANDTNGGPTLADDDLFGTP